MPQINSPTPDATTTSKGKIQLAGSLGGTASAPVLNLFRGTDANGWTVFNYDNWREYTKVFGPYSQSLTSNTGATVLSGQALPVGISPNASRFSLTHSIASGANGSQVLCGFDAFDYSSTSTSATFGLAIRNITAATLTPVGLYVSVRIIS